MLIDSGRRRRLLYHVLNALFLGILALYVALRWTELPARIPVHFDIDGEADRWADKGPLVALLLIGLPLAMTALLYASTLAIGLARRYPWMLNIPYKKAILALSPETQQPLWALLREMVAAIALGGNALFVVLSLGVVQTATGDAEFPHEMIWILLGGLLAIAVGYILALTALARQLAQSGEPTTPT